ncbi:MAG: CaiB/BaiF CoA-transferase family protein [Pseudomonadota bacterium]
MDWLSDIKVVDLSVNAPGPYASMMLAEMGAQVIAVSNPAVAGGPAYAGDADDPLLGARGGPGDALQRGKERKALDLKTAEGREQLLVLLDDADVLISEMRPGKLAALGLGWETLSPRCPRLILCEISGYGSRHSLADRAGHDINYIARAGFLDLVRDASDRPVIPQNLVADYAAGGTMAVTAILGALHARGRTGQGTRLDLSMTEGVRYLMSDIAAATALRGHPSAAWRQSLGGGMPTYAVYETADGGWMAVGALEPKFIAILADALEWPALSGLMADRAGWAEARAGLKERFATRSRAAWEALFDPLDACVAPVRSVDEDPPGALARLTTVFGLTGAAEAD